MKAVEEALLAAAKIAASKTSSVSSSAIDAFTSTWTTVRDPDFVASILCGLDPPDIAHAFVDVMKSYSKYTKSAFARIAMWKNRIARGLLVDGFGADATLLRQRCLFNGYDIETLGSSGLLHASSYRLELRDQLQSFIDSSIEDCYNKQLINLQESAVKKLQKGLLQNLITDDTKNTYETNEASMNANAALLRQQSFAVETALDDIQVPILNLTKEKAVRTITSALNDALLRFPDSPAAKIKRTKNVQKIVNKESKNKKKKPGQRSLGFGIDLVAMIRPDGFGSLQGFAGYALPGGNSITVGVHNDADDPQVIAQFGGVRPPLLRVQPKLRIDVEL